MRPLWMTFGRVVMAIGIGGFVGCWFIGAWIGWTAHDVPSAAYDRELHLKGSGVVYITAPEENLLAFVHPLTFISWILAALGGGLVAALDDARRDEERLRALQPGGPPSDGS